jgi:hypothetical protein
MTEKILVSTIKNIGYKDNRIYITYFWDEHHECFQPSCPFECDKEKNCDECEYLELVPYEEKTFSYGGYLEMHSINRYV